MPPLPDQAMGVFKGGCTKAISCSAPLIGFHFHVADDHLVFSEAFRMI